MRPNPPIFGWLSLLNLLFCNSHLTLRSFTLDQKVQSQAYVNRFFDEYRHCTVFAQMFELITPAWFAGLRPIDLPAALLWGEQERLLHVDQVRDYQALLPNSLVRIVPGWRHFPMIEQPEAYAGEIVALARELVDN
jgi:pimeloyl-ACP methyl ester carboxylesterase